MNEVLYDTWISVSRVFVFEFVNRLCIGAPSKDPAQRFVDLGFGIFEEQEKQEDKRFPKSKTTTFLSPACLIFAAFWSEKKSLPAKSTCGIW